MNLTIEYIDGVWFSLPEDLSPAQRDLYLLLGKACRALRGYGMAQRIAEEMIRHIPEDAPCPVSPAPNAEIARQLRINPATVRVHIRRLVALGLLEDRTGPSGHRPAHRRRGRIVALAGLDFSPLLARRDEIEASFARWDDERRELIALRTEIAATKRQIRQLLQATPEDVAATTRERLAALPRRYAHLPTVELVALRDRLVELCAKLEAEARR